MAPDPLGRAALLKSDAGRALILSSGAAHSCRPFWGVYSTSKAAVEALARTWAAETEQTHLRINSINPGATRTAMRAQAMPGEDPDTLPHPSEVAKAIVPLASRSLPRPARSMWFATRNSSATARRNDLQPDVNLKAMLLTDNGHRFIKQAMKITICRCC